MGGNRMLRARIRFRVDFNESCSIGPGKIELLEAIADCGSLSQAARDLGMSYRHAWLLISSLNSTFRQLVTTASTGGKRGGGMVLTPFGITVIKNYRELEEDIRDRAAIRLRSLLGDVVAPAADQPPVRRRRVSRSGSTVR